MAKNKPHPLATELQHEATRMYQGRNAGMLNSFPLTCIIQAVMREAPEVLQAFAATSLPHLVLSVTEYGIQELTINDYGGEPEPETVRVLIQRFFNAAAR